LSVYLVGAGLRINGRVHEGKGGIIPVHHDVGILEAHWSWGGAEVRRAHERLKLHQVDVELHGLIIFASGQGSVQVPSKSGRAQRSGCRHCSITTARNIARTEVERVEIQQAAIAWAKRRTVEERFCAAGVLTTIVILDTFGCWKLTNRRGASGIHGRIAVVTSAIFGYPRGIGWRSFPLNGLNGSSNHSAISVASDEAAVHSLAWNLGLGASLARSKRHGHISIDDDGTSFASQLVSMASVTCKTA